MNLQQLITFSTVIGEGSMTAAAEKIFLTQPAISQQIRNLEEELGVELIVRGTRAIKATLQGELLNEYAKKIIYLTQQAEIAIQTMADDVHGELRIGTLNSVGLHLVSPVVGLFLKHNSSLRVKMNYESGVEILKGAKKGEYDLVILPDIQREYGAALPEGFQGRYLMKDEMCLVGSTRDGSSVRSIEIEEFLSKPVVALSGKYPAFDRFLQERLSRHKLRMEPIFESTNVGTLKRVIESGLGWGFMPAHCIKKQIRTGRLSLIDVRDFQYDTSLIYYFSDGDRRLAAIADVFFRVLSQHLRG